jgi:hypothetical protein
MEKNMDNQIASMEKHTVLTIYAPADNVASVKRKINPQALFHSDEVNETGHFEPLYFYAITPNDPAIIKKALDLRARVSLCWSQREISLSSDCRDHLELVVDELGLKTTVFSDECGKKFQFFEYRGPQLTTDQEVECVRGGMVAVSRRSWYVPKCTQS